MLLHVFKIELSPSLLYSRFVLLHQKYCPATHPLMSSAVLGTRWMNRVITHFLSTQFYIFLPFFMFQHHQKFVDFGRVTVPVCQAGIYECPVVQPALILTLQFLSYTSLFTVNCAPCTLHWCIPTVQVHYGGINTQPTLWLLALQGSRGPVHFMGLKLNMDLSHQTCKKSLAITS